jgi:transcriptional regulator with XRE-family HTH domain
MKLSDKIIGLRKSNGMSQEDLAEKLNVSRQAISRWESGTAMPDASNILQLSKLFGVTTDYLLNDDYQSDNDLPKVKEVQNDNLGQIMIYLVTLEVMVLLMQFMTTVILQNVFFGFLSFIPFVAAIGGFEYAYQKKAASATEKTKNFRRKFYKISAWLGLYFPVRFIVSIAARFYPRPYYTLVLEVIILVIYFAAATCVNLSIDKSYLPKEQN